MVGNRTTVAVLAGALLGLGLCPTFAAADTRRVNNVQTITSVDLAGRFRAEIVTGGEAGATLTGPKGDLDRIGVRLVNGRLKLWEKCAMFCGRRDLDVMVRVVAPRIEEIDASKGVTVTALNVDAEALALDASMGAAVTVSGRCKMLAADVAMGASLTAKDLDCERVAVDASMGGTASVHASDTAVTEASMGGVIAVHGHPPHLDSSSSMGGTTTRED